MTSTERRVSILALTARLICALNPPFCQYVGDKTSLTTHTGFLLSYKGYIEAGEELT